MYTQNKKAIGHTTNMYIQYYYIIQCVKDACRLSVITPYGEFLNKNILCCFHIKTKQGLITIFRSPSHIYIYVYILAYQCRAVTVIFNYLCKFCENLFELCFSTTLVYSIRKTRALYPPPPLQLITIAPHSVQITAEPPRTAVS